MTLLWINSTHCYLKRWTSSSEFFCFELYQYNSDTLKKIIFWHCVSHISCYNSIFNYHFTQLRLFSVTWSFFFKKNYFHQRFYRYHTFSVVIKKKASCLWIVRFNLYFDFIINIFLPSNVNSTAKDFFSF